MLETLTIRGFKSLQNVEEIAFPGMTVLLGPNAAGKSNVLDALLALSRIGTLRTLADAMQEPIRGYPLEAFSLREGGLRELLGREYAEFTLEAKLKIANERYEYRITPRLDPRSGALTVGDEYLAALARRGTVKGNPSICRVDDQIRIRRKSRPAHPRQEPVGLNHSLLSDLRLAGVEYRAIEKCRNELAGWRTYYLDPRVGMRRAAPPAEVSDIGVVGEHIAPFLYRLQADRPKHFRQLVRALRAIIPSIENVVVELDQRRGTLDVTIRQHGTEFSTRVISEGTLRVLALCAIAVNPWGGSLVAFEEPENGVHPRRLELIADLLLNLSLERERQVIVTTHSPLFCGAILRRSAGAPGRVALYVTRQTDEGTAVRAFTATGPLFEDGELGRALAGGDEEAVMAGLAMRGSLDD